MFKQINAFSKNISSSVLKSYSHISGSTSTPNLFSTSISTSSSISSSATEPDASPPTSFSQETIELWIADTQRGIDALFDDNFVGAEDIFLQHLNESPFHAVGYALMGYIEAMLGFEPEKIQIATERLAHAEHLAHGFAKSASKESWLSHLKLSLRNGKDKGEKDVTSLSSPSSQPIHPASTRTSPASALPISAPSFPAASSSIVQNKSKNTPGLEYELLEANCILMSATIQFLRESWIDYMKAAYKLRKSYKMFDSMFSAVTGKSTSEYATELKRERKRNPPPRQHCRQSNTSSHYSSGSSSSGVSLPGSRPISVLQTPKTNNFSRKDSIQQTLDRLTSLPSNGSSPAPSPSTSSLSQNDFSSLTKQENIQQTLNILTASTESTIIYPYILAATPLHPFTTETFVNPGPSPSSSLASSPPTSSPSSSSPSSPIISTQPHSGSHFVPNPDDDFPFDTAQPTFPFKKTSKAAGRQSLWSVSSGAPLASAGASDSTHRKKMSKQEKRKSMPVFSSTSSTATLLYPPPPDPGTPSGLTEEGVMFGVGLFSLIFSLLPPRINKILNTLGFNSYRPFALHLLHRSYDSSGIYSSLSALSLLAYYTSFALFGHHALLPSSLRLADAHHILEDMKKKYPNGKIWRLMEGKLNKMEGNNRRGVEVLRDARRTIRRDGSGVSGNGNGFTGTSGVNGGKRDKAYGELAQLQALAVYEMGWGQIFLGDYFQASETFFRLESMNNWSRAFYHYIATCCMFADEEYGKAALEYLQIPAILHRRRFNARLMPNEAFADRKIRSWCEKARLLDGPSSKRGKHGLYSDDDEMGRRRESVDSISTKASSTSILDGDRLKQVVVVNPLWELVYLWNGIPQLGVEMLRTMCESLEKSIEAHTPLSRKGSISVSMASSISASSDSSISTLPSPSPALPSLCSTSEFALLHLLYGTTVRELGDHVRAERSFRIVLELEARMIEDRWVVPYTLYEMAVLCCIIVGMGGEAVALTTSPPTGAKRDKKIKEAKEWLKKAADWSNREIMATDQEINGSGKHGNGNVGPAASMGDYDFDGRLHIRCQLLEERLAEEV